jgi:hypothetical protein
MSQYFDLDLTGEQTQQRLHEVPEMQERTKDTTIININAMADSTGTYTLETAIAALGTYETANNVLYQLGINKRVKEPIRSRDDKIVPDVSGMGARDAVFVLENCGLRVKLHGRGKVKHQSYPAGKAAMKGAECVLTME